MIATKNVRFWGIISFVSFAKCISILWKTIPILLIYKYHLVRIRKQRIQKCRNEYFEPALYVVRTIYIYFVTNMTLTSILYVPNIRTSFICVFDLGSWLYFRYHIALQNVLNRVFPADHIFIVIPLLLATSLLLFWI